MTHKKEAYKADCYGDALRERIIEFANAGFDSIPADEREAWFSRFKFWGLFHQRSGQEGYFMLRLSNCGGVLTPGQLRVIGEIAREFATGPVENPVFGNGYLDLTTRQSVQLHWLELADIPAVFERLESVGLSSRSSGGDSMRNISGCPVAGKDRHEFLETRPLLDRLQTELRGDDSLCNMPRKFNISVTGCREGCAQDSINDVALEPAQTLIDGERIKGFNVRAGGGLGGREPRRARSLDIFVQPDHAYEIVRAFVEYYHETGDRTNRNRNRARFFVDEHGTDTIREELTTRVDFELHRAGTNLRDEYTYNAGRSSSAGKYDHSGVHKQPDGRNYVGLSVPCGRLRADEAIELAELADRYGSGEIRLTRRQNPIVTDVSDDALDGLLAASLLEELPPEPTPFSRGAIACTGTEFCPLALTETKARMAVLLRWLRANVTLPADVSQLKIHYSGCTADCGQALTADIGLQGMRARKNGEIVEALDVGVGGSIGTEPSFIEWVHQRVPADEVPGLLKNLLEAFGALRSDGQTFRDWVDATGHETLIELAQPEETDYEDPCLYDGKQSWYPFASDERPVGDRPATADD